MGRIEYNIKYNLQGLHTSQKRFFLDFSEKDIYQIISLFLCSSVYFKTFRINTEWYYRFINLHWSLNYSSIVIEDHRRVTWLDVSQDIKIQIWNKSYSVYDYVTATATIVFFSYFGQFVLGYRSTYHVNIRPHNVLIFMWKNKVMYERYLVFHVNTIAYLCDVVKCFLGWSSSSENF